MTLEIHKGNVLRASYLEMSLRVVLRCTNCEGEIAYSMKRSIPNVPGEMSSVPARLEPVGAV